LAEDETPQETAPEDRLTLVERTVFIAAPPEVVFDFLTKPELLARWLGRAAASAPRPGDPLSITFEESGRIALGVFREVSPPRRVVFTWGWRGEARFPPGASLVEIELAAAAGGTRLTLRHSAFPVGAPAPFSPADHEARWQRYLAQLQARAGEDATCGG
jgi:uncharacterized protein YndB with AHSA1/START domain